MAEGKVARRGGTNMQKSPKMEEREREERKYATNSTVFWQSFHILLFFFVTEGSVMAK